MFRRRPLLAIGLLAICGLLGSAIVWGYGCLTAAVQADANDHAYGTVLNAVILYIEDRHEWPKDWEAVTPFMQQIDADPQRLAAMPSRVRVDFDVSLRDVARMAPGTFAAIEPIDPNYGRDEKSIARLLEAARFRAKR